MKCSLPSELQKCLRIMKTSIFLLFLCISVAASNSTFSQTSTMSINARNKTLKQVFTEIENNSEYIFVFNDQQVNLNKKVSVSLKDESLEKVLTTVLDEESLDYKISGRQIILFEKPNAIKEKTEEAQASKKAITGRVLDADGQSIIGVSVVEVGTSNGMMTDIDGSFKLSVESNARLQISFIGYQTQTIAIQNQTEFEIILKEDPKVLDEVVVTALGIERSKKSLGYALQEVKGSDLLETRDANIANSLAGKIAGLDVRQSPSGAGGSSRIVLRGNSSLTGNNQPLIVVDGVPVDGSTGADNDDQWGEQLVDRGSGMADISPDDIESMSVLKGPAAAALYGSRAGNGVIMINTKTGKGTRGLGVSYSMNLTVDKLMQTPKFQNQYGQGTQGEINVTKDYGRYSWGAPINNQTYTDYVGRELKYEAGGADMQDFLQTGSTWTNSVDITNATEKNTVRLGVTHLRNEGVVPNNEFKRTSATLRATSKLSDKLSVDGKGTFTHQNTDNMLRLGGNHDNVFQQFLVMPRSVNMNNLRLGDGGYHASYNGIVDPYAWPAGTNIMSEKDPVNTSGQPVSYVYPMSGNTANPYFSAYNNTTNNRRNRFIGFASAKYEFTDWLNLQVRYGIDYLSTQYQNVQGTGTVFSTYADVNGNVLLDKSEGYEMNTDFLLSFKKNFLNDRLGIMASVGGNTMYTRSDGIWSTANGLNIEYYYSIANGRNIEATQNKYRKKLNSLYGTTSFSWDNAYYLDFTARNDWSSALPTNNNSYFYPSVGASWLFSETFKSKIGPINYGKVRLSWAEVGNDTDAYRTRNYMDIKLGAPLPSTVKANADLKNETVTSYEIGLELSAFENRLSLDFAFYNKDAKDQIFAIKTSPTTGYFSEMINAGKIRNRGFEVVLSGKPIESDNFHWNVSFNFSKNKNEIIKLHPKIDEFLLSHRSYSDALRIVAKEGGKFGDMYGTKYLRNEGGELILGSDGLPQATSEKHYLGNANPKWMGGLINQFSYKGIDLAFQIDIRYGGKVYMGSLRQGALAGTLDFTAANREPGSIKLQGVNKDGEAVVGETYAEEYWRRVAGSDGPTEEWIKDATNLRLRELSIGYNIPPKVLSKTFVRSAKISFVGRNLWMIHSKVKGFDPEAGYSTGNAQGFEYGSMPTLRSFGFNLNVTF